MPDTIYKVETKGVNPLLMLHKLGDLGAIEILEAGTHVKFGIDYHYHVIAKVQDGLYLEAYDPINELIDVGDRRFVRAAFSNTTNGAVTATVTPCPAQELTDTLWNSFSQGPTTVNYAFGLEIPDDPWDIDTGSGLLFPAMAVSVFSKIGINPSSSDIINYSQATSTPSLQPVTFRLAKNGGRLITPFGVSNAVEAIMSVNFAAAAYELKLIGSLPNNTPTVFTTDALLGEKLYRAAGYYNGSRSASWPSNCIMLAMSSGTYAGNNPGILGSGAVIRIAASISAEGDLIQPTEWFEFPVHTTAYKIGMDGIVFSNPSTPTCQATASYHYIGLLNTTKGNNFGGGSCPIIARFNKASGGGAFATTEGLCYAKGDLNPLSGEKRMTLHSPTIPVASDVQIGGPIVTNIFAIAEDEIRGVFPAFLSCNIGLSVGTMGWLGGKRFKVFKPGMLMRMG